jgi:hypothetical protein
VIPPFSFGQFARLLALDATKVETEIHRIFDRMEAPKDKRVAPPYNRARYLIRQVAHGRITLQEARAAIVHLRADAKAAKGRKARRLLDNAEMVLRFVDTFDLTGLVAGEPRVFWYQVHNLRLRVAADLCLRGGAQLIFVKLVFTKAAATLESAGERSHMRKIMFSAIWNELRHTVSGRDVIVLNVFHREPLDGRMLDLDLTAAMGRLALVIERVWKEREAARASKTTSTTL